MQIMAAYTIAVTAFITCIFSPVAAWVPSIAASECNTTVKDNYLSGKAEAVCTTVPTPPGCVGGYYSATTSPLVECAPGTFCPLGLSCWIGCGQGFTCPNASTSPTFCPASYYCSSPAASQKLCPKGFYCIAGSTKPAPCGLFSICPAGSARPEASWGGMLGTLSLLALLVLMYSIYSLIQREQRRSEKEQENAMRTKLITDGKWDWSATEATRATRVRSMRLMRAESSGGGGGGGRRPLSTRLFGAAPKSVRNMLLMGGGGQEEEDAMEQEETRQRRESMAKPLSLPVKERQMHIEFDNLGLRLKGSGRKVLAGVTGVLRGGQVTAIMGPSGAGKTTFCNVLAAKAFYGNPTGHILINGRPDSITQYSSSVGFVPQDDTMLRELSVLEILTFYAQLRLPGDMPGSEKAQIVEDVIRILGLWAVRHDLIGDEETRGISGGQRKRVNVGIELVSDPTLLFLDEPTSGLDSTTSFELLAALRRVARRGVNIITVLHQPNYQIYQKFHNVLLLGVGGRTVYLGPSDGALPYFTSLGFTCPEHVNPADFFMDVIAGKMPRKDRPAFKPQDLFGLWEQHSNLMQLQQAGCAPVEEGEEGPVKSLGGSTDFSLDSGRSLSSASTGSLEMKVVADGEEYVPPSTHGMASFGRQVWLFCKRGLLQQFRAKVTFFSDAFLLLSAGVIMGSMYLRVSFYDIPMMNFITSLTIGLCSAVSSLRTFGNEKAVFWREASSGAGMSSSRAAYFLGKNLCDLPRLSLLPLFFLAMFYNLTTPYMHFYQQYTICAGGAFAVSGIAYALSIMMKPKNAQLAALVVALLSCSISGVGPTLPDLAKRGPLAVAFYSVSFARYMMEALFVQETDAWSEAYDPLIKKQLEYYGYVPSALTQQIVILFAMGFIWRFLALVALYASNRGPQNREPLSLLFFRALARRMGCGPEPITRSSASASSASAIFGSGRGSTGSSSGAAAAASVPTATPVTPVAPAAPAAAAAAGAAAGGAAGGAASRRPSTRAPVTLEMGVVSEEAEAPFPAAATIDATATAATTTATVAGAAEATAAADGVAAVGADEGGAGATAGADTTDTAVSAPSSSLPAPWEEATTEAGELYYVNSDTSETQWERPT